MRHKRNADAYMEADAYFLQHPLLAKAAVGGLEYERLARFVTEFSQGGSLESVADELSMEWVSQNFERYVGRNFFAHKATVSWLLTMPGEMVEGFDFGMGDTFWDALNYEMQMWLQGKAYTAIKEVLREFDTAQEDAAAFHEKVLGASVRRGYSRRG